MGVVCRCHWKLDSESSLGRRQAPGALVSPFILPCGRALGCITGCILNLNVFLSSKEVVPHLGDFMLHQVLVEGVSDLQPTDECRSSHAIIVVIHQGYLPLEITDIVFKALSGLHLDRKEVIIVLLQLLLGSVLVVEGILHLFEAP